ncbi:MAG: hypothetical protein JNL12_09230 [Planctomycetes bacterium]|nr:hypothetical protein [Planctomycetota bacterium]
MSRFPCRSHFAQIAAVLGISMLWATRDQQGPAEFVLKDSKGRVRVSVVEEGDWFGLKIAGPDGGGILVGSAGDQAASIRMVDSVGAALVTLACKGNAVEFALSPGTDGRVVRIATDAEGAAQFSLGALREGGSRIQLAMTGKDEGRVDVVNGSGQSPSRVSLMNGVGGVGGVVVEKGADYIGGMLVGLSTGAMWVGDPPTKETDDWIGVRMGWDKRSGALVGLRHTGESRRIHVQDSEREGSGMVIGTPKKSYLRLGIGAVGPRIELGDGKNVIQRIPE